MSEKMAGTAKKGSRNKVATVIQHILRGDNIAGGEAFKRLYDDNPTAREIIDAAIVYIHNPEKFPDDSTELQKKATLLRHKLALAEIDVESLKRQIKTDDRLRHTFIAELKKRLENVRYYDRDLMVARQTIRNQEREIATLKAQVNGTFAPTDLEFQNLSIEIEKQALEIVRLKGRRIEKNRQIAEWRRWMILCHEYAAALRADPKAEAPDPNWLPPSWRPDADEEKDDAEMVALVAGLRSEIAQLESRNKYLSQSLQEAREQVKGHKAALTEGQDWGETLSILVDDIDPEQIAIALYEHDPDAAARLTDKMVVAFGKSLGEQITEFAKFFKALCDEPESSPLNDLFDKAQRYDNPIFWLGADEAREYAETILKELGSEKDAEIDRLKQEVERLTAEIERLAEPAEPDDAPEMVWVVKFNSETEPDNYQVYVEKEAAESYYNDYDDSYPGGATLQTEPATNFDFRWCRLVDGQMFRGQSSEKPPKRITGPEPQPSPPTPEPVVKPEPIIKAPPPSAGPRGRHFGAYPDPQSMEHLRALSARLRLDNTALLRWLIDNELAHPPTKLPPRRKRANRVHHFGAYPDAETWAKIRELLARYKDRQHRVGVISGRENPIKEATPKESPLRTSFTTANRRTAAIGI